MLAPTRAHGIQKPQPVAVEQGHVLDLQQDIRRRSLDEGNVQTPSGMAGGSKFHLASELPIPGEGRNPPLGHAFRYHRVGATCVYSQPSGTHVHPLQSPRELAAGIVAVAQLDRAPGNRVTSR